MIALHHFGFSTCSQKVRLVLAEKGLDFESHEVDLIAGEQHDPDYVKLNPKHVVPTLVHDGHVLVESSLIVKYLDDAFPDPPLRPADALGRYAVEAWTLPAVVSFMRKGGAELWPEVEPLTRAATAA